MNRGELEERQLEIANRMKNIIWTVCGDYTLETKPDVEAFLKSKYIALYDGIKQGAFAKYFEKEKLSMYLVKKVYLGAREDALVAIAQLCMEKAVGDRIVRERKGVTSIQKKAYEYVLDHEMDTMVKSEFGRLQLAMMRQVLTGERRCEEKIRKQLDRIEPLEEAADTMEVIRTIDDCYNAWVDPGFEQIHGDLSKVLAVTVEELMEYSWRDFLTEEMYEENFEAYLEQMSQQMTATGQNHAEEKKDEKESSKKRKIVRVSEEELKKVYTYIELNFGKTYLSPLEEKRINFQLCRGIHADCGLYFTDGILANPVKKNYQLEYAKKQQGKNKYAYYDNHRTVKQNITILSGILKKSHGHAAGRDNNPFRQGKDLPGKTLEDWEEPGCQTVFPDLSGRRKHLCGGCFDRCQRFPEGAAGTGGAAGIYHHAGFEQRAYPTSCDELLYLLGSYDYAALPGI